MSGLLDLLDFDSDARLGRRIQGVVTGVVTNNQDPEKLGRVRIRFPWLSDTDESWWARVASPSAGKGRGTFFLPEVDDEVLVAFEHGDLRFPYVVGSLWNSGQPPLAANDDGKNNLLTIKSRSGHTIVLDDTDGDERISITDKSEKNSIVISSKTNSVAITSEGDITLSCPKGKLKIDADVIEVTSKKHTALHAGGKAVVKGSTIELN
jgi:uncharacterized protein involved in type VI secretion and phage assembly